MQEDKRRFSVQVKAHDDVAFEEAAFAKSAEFAALSAAEQVRNL